MTERMISEKEHAAAIATARLEALEMAAKECERHSQFCHKEAINGNFHDLMARVEEATYLSERIRGGVRKEMEARGAALAPASNAPSGLRAKEVAFEVKGSWMQDLYESAKRFVEECEKAPGNPLERRSAREILFDSVNHFRKVDAQPHTELRKPEVEAGRELRATGCACDESVGFLCLKHAKEANEYFAAKGENPDPIQRIIDGIRIPQAKQEFIDDLAIHDDLVRRAAQPIPAPSPDDKEAK